MVDVTKDFINKLIANGQVAHQKAGHDLKGGVAGSALGPAGAILGAGLGMAARWAWFYKQVRNGGPWDFKNNDYRKHKSSGLIICGTTYGNDMPGNFHFGFVGRAAGFTAYSLQKGAGVAQERAGTSRPEFHCTYGDDPKDNAFIQLGIKLYEGHKLAITTKNLGSILGQFKLVTCSTP